MFTLNGVPASRPTGTGANVVPPQHGQCPAYRSTRVTTARIGGRSILSYRLCSDWSPSVKADWQCAQHSGLATTSSSGSLASSRPPPSRPRLPCRGPPPLGLSRRLAFWPFDGGRLELVGVFGGSLSFASSSAMRRSAAASRSNSALISASFSAWLSWLRSRSGGTSMLNRGARDRVNHILARNRGLDHRNIGETHPR